MDQIAIYGKTLAVNDSGGGNKIQRNTNGRFSMRKVGGFFKFQVFQQNKCMVERATGNIHVIKLPFLPIKLQRRLRIIEKATPS